MAEFNRAIRLLAKSFVRMSEIGIDDPTKTGEELFNLAIMPSIEFERNYFKSFREYPRYINFPELETGTSIVEVCFPDYKDEASIEGYKSLFTDQLAANPPEIIYFTPPDGNIIGARVTDNGTTAYLTGRDFIVVDGDFFGSNILIKYSDNPSAISLSGDLNVSFTSDSTGTLNVMSTSFDPLDSEEFALGYNNIIFSDLTGIYLVTFSDIDSTTNISNFGITFAPDVNSDTLYSDKNISDLFPNNFNMIFINDPIQTILEIN